MKGAHFNADKQQIKLLINKLFRLSKLKSISGDIDYDKGTLDSLRQLENVKKIWGIKTREKKIETIDRTGSMYGEFPYTFKKYPWPTNSNGQYICPLVQSV